MKTALLQSHILFSFSRLHPPYRTRFSTHFLDFSLFSLSLFLRSFLCFFIEIVIVNAHFIHTKTWKLCCCFVAAASCKKKIYFFRLEFNIIRLQLYLSFEICCSVGVDLPLWIPPPPLLLLSVRLVFFCCLIIFLFFN